MRKAFHFNLITLKTGLSIVLLSLCHTVYSADQRDATELKATFHNGGGEGWSEDDEINIYTLSSMRHNKYRLYEGEGTPEAMFERYSGSDNYDNPGNLYALTSCKYLYAFSATFEGIPKITVEIPYRLPLEEVIAPEGTSRMPIPYWGETRFGDDGKLEASFSGMTALLKIDTRALPIGTQAVILTTHHYTDLTGSESPAGGNSEPISGMFETILEEGAQLTSNPIFLTYDTLRVNISPDEEIENHNLYIPVIARNYTNLHVIAVTGDSSNPYEWKGKVLKTFNQETPLGINTIISIEAEEPVYAPGDANGDGTINAADIVEVVNYIMGNPTASFIFSAADINNDGSVNAADIVLIVNAIMFA
jgi:hypothetical protein